MSAASARCRRTGVVILLAGLALSCRGTVSQRTPIHLNPNMDDQVRYDAQEDSPFFADGRAMRLPPPGTVAAGAAGDEHLLAGTVDGQPATTLPSDIRLDAALLRRGQDRYDIYCAPCHDATGSGQGSAVKRGMLPPPSFHDDRLRAQGVGYLYGVARQGIRNMQGYGDQLSVEDGWAVAAYVRTLQRSRMATREQVPQDVLAEKGWTE
jgi:mono/diheme cytochrome c family protein